MTVDPMLEFSTPDRRQPCKHAHCRLRWPLLIALVLGWTGWAASGRAEQLFAQPPGYYPVGTQVGMLAIGDVNGDSLLDIAVADQAVRAVRILTGDGHGRFVPGSVVQVLHDVSALALADLNHDGRTDLVVTGGATVSTLLGTGPGQFSLSSSTSVGLLPSSVVVADVNRDGAPDLVIAISYPYPVADNSDNTIAVLPGNGDGTFGAVAHFKTGSRPTRLGVRDFDADSVLDIAALDAADDAVTILSGHGDGTFGLMHNVATGPLPLSMAVGDLDRDSVADLVVSSAGDGVFGPSVWVRLGQGDGTFGSPIIYPTPWPWVDVVVTDLDGDGNEDVVGAVPDGHAVQVMLGAGGGMLGALSTHDVRHGALWLAADDFDRDGHPDVACSLFQSDSVAVLIGATGRLGIDGGFREMGRACELRLASENPGRGGVRFEVWLAEPGELSVDLNDVAGRLVGAIELGRQDRGWHGCRWAGALEPGMYFATARAGGSSETRRVVVLR